MNLHIMKASGRLIGFEGSLTSAFNEVAEKVKGKIPLPEVDVVIVDNQDNIIPETGVGGFAINANLVYVNIDPESSYFKNHAHEEIVSTLTHELHHCARMNKVGYGKSLLEAMASEGLADHFDIEINNHAPNPWSVALTDSQLDGLRTKAAQEFDSITYDHSAWFFGSEEKGIPRWTGYSLGFRMVQDYIKSTGKTAGELVSAEAKMFI